MPNTTTVFIPRWEWRTFAPSLSGLRSRIGDVTFEAPRESRETYVLCLKSSHNARVRGGTIDLKWRKQADPSGLELWVPVFTSQFPLAAKFMPRIFEAWGIPVPLLQRPAYTLEQFLGEIVDPDPDLAAVELTKRREAFVLDGTRCELATIRAGEVPMESFRLEHEDPSLVMQVLRRLGLDSRRNINYPMGLKAALGLLAA